MINFNNMLNMLVSEVLKLNVAYTVQKCCVILVLSKYRTRQTCWVCGFICEIININGLPGLGCRTEGNNPL